MANSPNLSMEVVHLGVSYLGWLNLKAKVKEGGVVVVDDGRCRHCEWY